MKSSPGFDLDSISLSAEIDERTSHVRAFIADMGSAAGGTMPIEKVNG